MVNPSIVGANFETYQPVKYRVGDGGIRYGVFLGYDEHSFVIMRLKKSCQVKDACPRSSTTMETIGSHGRNLEDADNRLAHDLVYFYNKAWAIQWITNMGLYRSLVLSDRNSSIPVRMAILAKVGMRHEQFSEHECAWFIMSLCDGAVMSQLHKIRELTCMSVAGISMLFSQLKSQTVRRNKRLRELLAGLPCSADIPAIQKKLVIARDAVEKSRKVTAPQAPAGQ